MKVGTYTDAWYFEKKFGWNLKGLFNIQLLVGAYFGNMETSILAEITSCGGYEYGQTFSDWESVDLEEHQIKLATRKLRQLNVFKYVLTLFSDWEGYLPDHKLYGLQEYMNQKDNFVELTDISLH